MSDVTQPEQPQDGPHDMSTPTDDAVWWGAIPTSEVLANPDQTKLAIRLGMAVNALRAQQRFFLAVKNDAGPAGERDQIAAFTQGIAYLHEALNLLDGMAAKWIRDWADAIGFDADARDAVHKLRSGSDPFSRVVYRVRNSLVFHWQTESLDFWFEALQTLAPATVVWIEGASTNDKRQTQHRVSADAVVIALLGGEITDLAGSQAQLRWLMSETARASEYVTDYYNAAVLGYLQNRRLTAFRPPP